MHGSPCTFKLSFCACSEKSLSPPRGSCWLEGLLSIAIEAVSESRSSLEYICQNSRFHSKRSSGRHRYFARIVTEAMCFSHSSWSLPVLPVAVIVYFSFSMGACGFSIFMSTRPKSMLAS
jgi:hypothetical protein